MTISLAPPHEQLTFMAPLSDARADDLVRFLTADRPRSVLDVGCGWAELLLRAVAAAPGAHGVGVDSDEKSIEHATTLAEQRGLTDRVTLVCGDAKHHIPLRPDAVLCIGATQVWGPPVEDDQPLAYASALAAIRAAVPRGARVVYGDGIWSTPPTTAAVAPLSGRFDEMVTLAELVDLAVEHGFMPVAVGEADIDEWDRFESGYGARYAAWLAEHDPDHPDAAEVRERAARQRAGYFGGYRGVLGMAYLALVAV